MWWLWLYDPFTMFAMFIAYILGFLGVILIADKIAPKVAGRVSGRLGLHASMSFTALAIIIGSLASIYVIYLALDAFGIAVSILGLLIFIVVMDIGIWLFSPWLVTAMYHGEHDPGLQEIVDRVARRAGFRDPPKAYVVDGPPNAFAYGNFLSGRRVAVTREMLNLVDGEELEAVIGHELGHHRHRDNAIMLVLGIFPSIIYYLGLMLIRAGLIGGTMRLSGRRDEGGGGIVLLAIGVFAIFISIIIQVLVLAFSRLREYYADAHGAFVAGARNMQKALAKLHLYYQYNGEDKLQVTHSKLRTMFIYAFTEAVANPFYSPYRRVKRIPRVRNIDRIIEELKNQPVSPSKEVMMSHPPIPKRLRFLDRIAAGIERIH